MNTLIETARSNPNFVADESLMKQMISMSPEATNQSPAYQKQNSIDQNDEYGYEELPEKTNKKPSPRQAMAMQKQIS